MSCLFNSLQYFIKDKSSYEIRQMICDYLENNKPIIDGLETKFILELESNNYINNMRDPSVWGGAIEIQVACNIWCYNIKVRNYRDILGKVIEFIPINNKIDKNIELEWTGGHYEPVRK